MYSLCDSMNSEKTLTCLLYEDFVVFSYSKPISRLPYDSESLSKASLTFTLLLNLEHIILCENFYKHFSRKRHLNQVFSLKNKFDSQKGYIENVPLIFCWNKLDYEYYFNI